MAGPAGPRGPGVRRIVEEEHAREVDRVPIHCLRTGDRTAQERVRRVGTAIRRNVLVCNHLVLFSVTKTIYSLPKQCFLIQNVLLKHIFMHGARMINWRLERMLSPTCIATSMSNIFNN